MWRNKKKLEVFPHFHVLGVGETESLGEEKLKSFRGINTGKEEGNVYNLSIVHFFKYLYIYIKTKKKSMIITMIIVTIITFALIDDHDDV